jgi:hypothetical protein
MPTNLSNTSIGPLFSAASSVSADIHFQIGFVDILNFADRFRCFDKVGSESKRA